MGTAISEKIQSVVLEETYHIHSEEEEEEEDNEYSSSSDEESSSSSSSQSSHNDKETAVFSDELQITPQSVTFSEDDLIELSLLREEEIDHLVSSNLLPQDSRFDPTLHDQLTFPYPELILTLTTGPKYPVLPLSYTVQNLTLPRLIVDNLRITLRNIMITFSENESLSRWLNRSTNSNYGIYDPDLLALSLAKATNEHITTYRSSLSSKIDISSRPLDIKTTTTRSQILSSEHGVDVTTYDTPPTIKDLLGKSIPQICEQIPTNYRILHVENVLKPRLYADFHTLQSTIRSRLLTLSSSTLSKSVSHSQHRHLKSHHPHGALAERRERETLATILTTPKITYHGTPRTNIPNIVKHGFLRPGDLNPSTNTSLQIRCGNTYGRGIYTSPSPQFSLMYSGYDATPTPVSQFSGLKLIVCATIMGRSATVTRDDNWREQSKPYPNADSHVANNEYEYIVFQPRQTIPVLIIHLDWGKEHYEEFVNIPTNPLQWIEQMKARRKEKKEKKRYEAQQEEENGMFPADVVRRKQALMARALKWFPYGYGPSTGTKFVVEAVADDSDDEEEYGEYQGDKVDGVDGGKAEYFWEMPEVEGEDQRFDEFFEERRAKTSDVVKGKEAKAQEEEEEEEEDR
ncbi:hypothetical protein TWF281_005108 [Arthrobotrys megalospora]